MTAKLDSDTTEIPDSEPVKVTVGDHRLILAGHAPRKLTCAFLSILTQSAARILGAQGLLSRKVEIQENVGYFDMAIIETDIARQGLAGILSSINKIAREMPGDIVISDCRKIEVVVHRPADAQNDASTGTFAALLPMRNKIERARAPITDVDGRNLVSA